MQAYAGICVKSSEESKDKLSTTDSFGLQISSHVQS